MTFKQYKEEILLNYSSKFNFNKIDDRYYYVYRITNIHKHKFYYGSRVSLISPNLDLGIKYFSSSSDKIFINEQKETPQNYNYKIVKVFDNNADKMLFESYLHMKFDVKNNSFFYNRTNQMMNGFDSTGRVSCIDESGNSQYVLKEEFDRRPDLHNSQKGKVFSSQKRIEMSNRMKKVWLSRTDEYRRYIGKKASANRAPRTTEHKLNLKKALQSSEVKEKISRLNSGINNGNAKIYYIYDNLGILKHTIYGGFSKYCKTHKLPFDCLHTSYRNNGAPIYQNLSKAPLQRIKNNGNIQYIGWRCVCSNKH